MQMWQEKVFFFLPFTEVAFLPLFKWLTQGSCLSICIDHQDIFTASGENIYLKETGERGEM